MKSEIGRYVKKPIQVEAVLLTRDNIDRIANWCGGEINKFIDTDGTVRKSIKIHTLEGDHMAQIGDYIIRGIVGEFYPCRGDIFEMTYFACGEEPGGKNEKRCD